MQEGGFVLKYNGLYFDSSGYGFQPSLRDAKVYKNQDEAELAASRFNYRTRPSVVQVHAEQLISKEES